MSAPRIPTSPIQPLTREQLEIITSPPHERIFLEGPAGTGKTTVGVERLVHLLESGIPGNDVLILVPQRALGKPYYSALYIPGLISGGLPNVITIGGLARRMVELFWPLISQRAGFDNPDQPPHFLTLETAQYYMQKAGTSTGLNVVVRIIDKVFETGRKYAANFKETMTIQFDDFLPKWNYTAIPQTG
jgi:hypothetical protein